MRSGFVGNAENLIEQVEWRGLKTMGTGTLAYARYIDEPQRQLGANILPADPVALFNARPEQYPADESWPVLMQGGQPLYLQGGRISMSLQYNKYFQTNQVVGAGWPSQPNVVQGLEIVLDFAPGWSD